LSLLVLSQLDVVPGFTVWLMAIAQAYLLWSLGKPVHQALNVLTARLGFAQSYEAMLRTIEGETFRAPHLIALQERLRVQGVTASQLMQRLARYEGFAQLRTQGPLYIVLNVVLLWDLFCLERIEHFLREVGPHCEEWFRTVGELELLCSLATLQHIDVSARMPELRDDGVLLHAMGMVHPLLSSTSRVANDLALDGPGTALIVTGSNMAGKSTLLRAVGLNVALALAGGPVCAREFSLSPFRLRASMRIDDSLQRGASYFHAELTRLRMVVGTLEQGPPVLFLLDELLRGTNAHARHQGARAVLMHLLSRGALGLVATHDVALSELEEELPGKVRNVHFTDVFEGGEMRFDYTLRQGVVKTSNALRLLKLAGIEVPDSDALG
jgi:DNA mismatch repair ATPase MutS